MYIWVRDCLSNTHNERRTIAHILFVFVSGRRRRRRRLYTTQEEMCCVGVHALISRQTDLGARTHAHPSINYWPANTHRPTDTHSVRGIFSCAICARTRARLEPFAFNHHLSGRKYDVQLKVCRHYVCGARGGVPEMVRTLNAQPPPFDYPPILCVAFCSRALALCFRVGGWCVRPRAAAYPEISAAYACTSTLTMWRTHTRTHIVIRRVRAPTPLSARLP